MIDEDVLYRQIREAKVDLLGDLAMQFEWAIDQERQRFRSQLRQFRDWEAKLGHPLPPHWYRFEAHAKRNLEQLSSNLRWGVAMETRVDLLRHLAAIAGPVVPVSALSQLLALATDAESREEAVQIIQHTVWLFVAHLTLDEDDKIEAIVRERSTADQPSDELTEQEQKLAALRTAVVNRLMRSLGVDPDAATRD